MTAHEAKQWVFYERIPRDLDRVDVTLPYSGNVIYSIRGTNLFAELDSILEFKPGALEITEHGCGGLADILFYRQSERCARWNFGHGTFWILVGALSEESEKRLADWFAGKGVKEFQLWLGNEDAEGFPRPPKKPTAYEKGLDWLAKKQNQDGSWGEAESSVYMTSFALTAFLQHGDTPASARYGESVEKAARWLVEHNPANATDRAAAIHALSALWHLTRAPISESKLLSLTRDFNVEQVRGAVLTLLRITKPVDADAEVDAKANALLRNAVSTAEEQTPSLLYLETLDTMVNRGSEWDRYYRAVLLPITETMKKDGVAQRVDNHSELESTIFSLLSIGVSYRLWEVYLSLDVDISATRAESPP